MLYFKKVFLTDETEKANLKQSLQKATSDRTFPLDFIRATIDLSPDKTFLGFENEKGIQFARLRSTFEVALPRLIIYLPKETNANYYKIRFSWVTLIVFAFIAFILPLLIWGIVNGSQDYKPMLGISLLCVAYPFWILIELDFTTCKIQEAIHENKINPFTETQYYNNRIEMPFEEGLVLFLINTINLYRSSYELIKVLSRMFDIFYGSEILESMVHKKFLEERTENQLSFYKLTLLGEQVLEKHQFKIVETIKKDYHSKNQEYIESLLSRHEDQI